MLAKTLDSTQLTTDKLEVSTITRDDKLGRVMAASCTVIVPLIANYWSKSERSYAGFDDHQAHRLAVQVVYKVYEDIDLEPLLTEVNAIRKKEKDEES